MAGGGKSRGHITVGMGVGVRTGGPGGGGAYSLFACSSVVFLPWATRPFRGGAGSWGGGFNGCITMGMGHAPGGGFKGYVC